MKDPNNFKENLVIFPTQGDAENDLNHELVEHYQESHEDPLESLLQEFEEISNDLDNRTYEREETFSKAIENLPKVTTQRILPEDILSRDFSKALEFQTRIDLIHEVNKRIKYYLDELELFLPKK